MAGWLGMGSTGKEDRKHGDSFPTRGFLAAAVNSHFQRLDDGRTVFRLRSPFNCRGYVVASTEQMLLLRESVVRYRRIFMRSYIGSTVVFSGLFGTRFFEIPFWQQLAILVGIGALEWVGSRAYFYVFTKNMEPINVRTSRLASWRSRGRIISPTLLGYATLVTAGMASFMFYLSVKRSEPILLVLGLVFGASLLGYAIAWRSWWVARQE
ncbi:hypothetical protein KAR02_14660 [Candidatus Bipolaricaulota bacterium]|nr:hypothetical protein [Candidatus Bipolaricaulota bacterium]